MANRPGQPALIGIDWGSTNLRAALLDAQGTVLERRESADGVFHVAGGAFAAALWSLCAGWAVRHRVPLLACGMIGSRQGLVEVPYVPCPAGVAQLATGLGQARLDPDATTGAAGPVALHVVPGVCTGSPETGWDVIRGEETQLLGVPAGADGLFVMPGTHSKWVMRDAGGRIASFQTYMTGELFHLFQAHSSLARVMAGAHWTEAAFHQGVQEAREDALENLLFRVRTAGLMGRWPPQALADYLSGLLIGAEFRAGLRRFGPGAQVPALTLLGSAALTRRYALAAAVFGVAVTEVAGDAVFTGLAAVARAAGWTAGT